jgi:hypothetical protein
MVLGPLPGSWLALHSVLYRHTLRQQEKRTIVVFLSDRPPFRILRNVVYKPATSSPNKLQRTPFRIVCGASCILEYAVRGVAPVASRRWLLNRGHDSGCPDWLLHGFPEPLQANSGIVPQIRLRPLPSKSFPINYSPVILSDAGSVAN